MKADIHPKYFEEAVITCACGASYTIGSTKEKLHVEVCRACHPFYTGAEKIIDTAGRVERFKARTAAAKAHKEKTKASQSDARPTREAFRKSSKSK